MAYEATGRIVLVRDANQVTERFRKREFVLMIDPEEAYPKPVTFEFTGDRCDKLDGVQPGQDATVEFSLDGREWVNAHGETKYFTTLRAWRIKTEGTSEVPPVADEDVPF